MNLQLISFLLLTLCSYGFCQSHLSVDDTYFAPLESKFSGSPPMLTSLATKEELIYMLLTDFYKGLKAEPKNETTQLAVAGTRESEMDIISRYIKDYDGSSGKVDGNYELQKSPLRAKHVAWNPLATYHMIRRYATELRSLLQSLNPAEDNHLKTHNYITSIMRGFGWPSEEDLKLQMSAILRVQHIYDLDTREIAEGKIYGRETNVGLSGSDCYAIGKQGLSTNTYTLAVEWLELAAEKLRNESSPLSVLVEKDLEEAIIAHDSAWEKTQGWEHQYFVQRLKDQRHNRVKRRNVQFQTYKGGKTTNLNEINFWGLCSGENYQDMEEKKRLFCYYESKVNNNAWAINPIKVEIHSVHPLIIQYYDIIGDGMIERVKDEAEASLVRSTVVDEARAGGRKLSIARTSMSGWIPDHFRKPFLSIPKRITAITGLNAMGPVAAEDLQVASYAFGGHYEVHMDALKVGSETQGRGDRIATFMFYLSDVEKGGNTAFPIAGVAAKPVKGSAVYWHNLWSSGEPDERTWHGACPVILGEKWVANKWIRMYDQMNNYQCHPKGRHPNKFEVNGKPLQF